MLSEESKTYFRKQVANKAASDKEIEESITKLKDKIRQKAQEAYKDLLFLKEFGIKPEEPNWSLVGGWFINFKFQKDIWVQVNDDDYVVFLKYKGTFVQKIDDVIRKILEYTHKI